MQNQGQIREWGLSAPDCLVWGEKSAAKSTKAGQKMISSCIKGIEMAEIIPVSVLNCSERSKISDRKEQSKVIDLEKYEPAKQPRQNPA